MKAPLSWLRDFVEIDISCEELCDKLQGTGFEVEEVVSVKGSLRGIVVGKILNVQPHFQADNLNVCLVDIGTEICTIVTAAKNVGVGDYVPVATVGACIHDGTEISLAEIRGIYSQGMMLGGSELGIDNNVIMGAEENGILILQKGDLSREEFVCGEDILSVLELDDYVLDVSITTNRPDCVSIFGLAREISSILSKKLKLPSLKYAVGEIDLPLEVVIDNEADCNRYMGVAVRNVKIGSSPQEIRKRLWLCGHSSINNIVDITNYVLLEMGQPMHAFDYAKIDGSKIVVRSAKNGELLVALNQKECALSEDMLVIADSQKPLAIAGVMGGMDSAISSTTQDIVFEAAKFARGSVRATSRKLALRSDSSARFEKGVDVSSVPDGMSRALYFISKYKLGKICPMVVDTCAVEIAEREVVCDVSKITDLLGISIKQSEILRILRALRFDCEINKSVLSVTVPLFREDIEDYADLAEEIIRNYGYQNIISQPLTSSDERSVILGKDYIRESRINKVKDMLCGAGAHEICTYSLVNANFHQKMRLNRTGASNAIAISNPINEDCGVLRTNLAHSMLITLGYNNSHNNMKNLLFEIGKRYYFDQNNKPIEPTMLCVAASGGIKDFFELKSICDYVAAMFGLSLEAKEKIYPFLHNGVSAQLLLNGENVGYIGNLHPLVAENYSITESVVLFELDLDALLESDCKKISYVPFGRFPQAMRDLAVVVDGNTPAGELIATIKNSGGELLKNAEIFDIYTGSQIDEGKKSVAFSLVFGSNERTLKEDEINSSFKNILCALENGFGAKIRS